MNNRILLLVAVACLLLMPLGTSQESVSLSPDMHTWGNPYPGLGNVSPGIVPSNPMDEQTSIPSTITLYANNLNAENNSSVLLSQSPSSKLTKIIQKIDFDVLWAPASGSRGLGMTELDLSAMFALPMPAPDSALLITPKLTTDFFEAKDTALRGNETFYTTGLNVRWVRPICKNKLTADIGFGLFYSGDFKATGSDTLKFPAHAAGIWNLNPRTKILFGIIYTDRSDDFAWLPMVGIIWTPHDDLNVELMVPRVKVAQRVRWFGSGAGEEQSDWIYTAFEFGGGEWGYEYNPSVSGKVEYQDLRFLLGYERRTRCGATLGLEFGCMFERELDFVGYGKQDLSESVFFRFRSSF